MLPSQNWRSFDSELGTKRNSLEPLRTGPRVGEQNGTTHGSVWAAAWTPESRIMAATSNYVSAPKKATNVSIAETLLSEAKALRINVSQAAEAGLAKAVAEKRAELWLKENQEAIESSNAFVEKHGLPLENYRMF